MSSFRSDVLHAVRVLAANSADDAGNTYNTDP
jgi:hypothetical protein